MTQVPAEGLISHSLAPDRRLLGRRGWNLARDTGAAGLEFPPHLIGEQHHTVIDLGSVKRLVMMVTPEGGGAFRDEAWEAVSTIRAILRQQSVPMEVTMQTVFVRDRADVPVLELLFKAYYGERMPLTLFVVQPPCEGRGLAIEAWAVSTDTAKVEYHNEHLVTVNYGDMRWVYASGGSLHREGRTAYEQSLEAFQNLQQSLKTVGASFEDVVRVWLYQGCITEEVDGVERYRELNRARTDFFANIPFDHRRIPMAKNGHAIYPASTGIGTHCHGLITACMALQTNRQDVALLPLENPLQVSAFDYPKEYSAKSPKFARAMAVRAGEFVTTWISGTASIVNSETVFKGDAVGQTEQTLTNIEKLIAPENFARLGWEDAGATLDDLAKIHVYVKHAEDFEKVRAVCERRLGRLPAIYAVADVCRPDLLVEIEGVAFSRIHQPQHFPGGDL
ncbi:MAG: dioxygenase [Verrucomicrobiaceae bacterium]|nr:dioxygenase [Verrucomicrobiaceae bacterium]